MAQLSLDVRNYLAEQEDLRALLGKGQAFDTWIFDSKPLGKIEGLGETQPDRSAMVVIVESGQTEAPNQHNTLRFPRIFVDVWADPTRNRGGSVKMNDADIKIDKIHRVISKYLHLVDSGTRRGMPHVWGKSVINNSHREGDPDYRDVREGNGARMATVSYGFSVL